MVTTTTWPCDAKTVFMDKLTGLCMSERMSDVRFVYHKDDPTKEVFILVDLLNLIYLIGFSVFSTPIAW
jgi:hypothetical protein